METIAYDSAPIATAPNKPFTLIAHTMPLVLLVIFLLISGLSVSLYSLYSPSPNRHWMEGIGIAILIIFLPLTAISYLHFRLPMKKEEFKTIRKMLKNENETIETFSVDFHQHNSCADYLLPIFFVTFFSAMGFYILLSNKADVLFKGMEWVAEAQGNTGTYDTVRFRSSVVAISMSFLGAYIWSIQYIFRRMMTLDLPPGAYYSTASRMVYSVFLAVILQHFISANIDVKDNLVSQQLVAVSFLVGIFPERALSWMKESLGQIFSQKSSSAKPMPLEMLEGISNFHKARLGELGIDNVQNLAQASLLELILKTPFGPRILVDWMAQARLCLEFKEDVVKIRNAGVRTILDLLEVDADESLLKAVAENSEINFERIKTICMANRNEKSIVRLRSAYDALNMI